VGGGPGEVGGGHFFVIDGHRQLSAALRNEFPFVPASLVAEGAEPVVGGLSADAYFASEVGASLIYDWAELHGTELPLPPHLLREGRSAVLD
jgi:hypothetical protein